MRTFKNSEEAVAAFNTAVRKFRDTDYENVEALEIQEDELIGIATSVIEYLAGQRK